jgi:hypothetical protein
MARQNRKKKTRAQKMAGGSMLSDPKRNAYAQGGEEDGLLYETMAYLEAKAVVSNPNSSGEDQAQAQATLDTLKPEEQGGTVDPQIYAQMMQEVDAEAAKKAPVKKAEGGSMLNPPEREAYQEGSEVRSELFDQMGKQGDNIDWDRWTQITSEDPTGPLNPASKKGLQLIEELDRERRKHGDRTFTEASEDFWFEVSPVGTNPLAYFLQDVGARNRFTKEHPNLVETINALKASKERIEKATTETEEKTTRSQKAEGGSMLVPSEMAGMEAPVDTYPNIPPEEIAAVEASQLPDAEVESDYVDFVMNEALEQEEQSYLMTALEADPQLSMIFDKVVDTASEFSGAGPVDGPGDGVSDSIPARLSAGEFVVTKKATDQIGADNLQTMMDEAERAYDGGLMGTDKAKGENINEAMLFSNQMPSLNVRQR